jgi:hypothetical protein
VVNWIVRKPECYTHPTSRCLVGTKVGGRRKTRQESKAWHGASCVFNGIVELAESVQLVAKVLYVMSTSSTRFDSANQRILHSRRKWATAVCSIVASSSIWTTMVKERDQRHKYGVPKPHLLFPTSAIRKPLRVSKIPPRFEYSSKLLRGLVNCALTHNLFRPLIRQCVVVHINYFKDDG